MRYFLLMSLIMPVATICIAEEENVIGYYEENGRKEALNLSETMDVITKKDDLSNLILNSMPSPLCKEKASISKKYAKTLITTVKTLVPENPNSDIIANERTCNKLIQLRNKLLEAGGYSNICLAGSLAGTIDAFYFQTFLNGNTIKPEMIKKNKLDLKDIIRVIEASDKTEFKTSILSEIDINNGTTEVEQLRILLGDENKPKKGPVNFGNWRKFGEIAILFNGQALGKPSSISYLYNWIHLIDEQKSIEIINKTALQDSTFLLFDDKLMKDAIQKYLDSNYSGIMLSSLEPWSARRVFDFFRKFKGSILTKGDSPYTQRLSDFLKYK